MTSRLLPLALLLSLSLVRPSAAATVSAPDTLADSTVVEHWTLANGLEVSTRHIPGARAVAITVGYAFGSDDDPPGREGLAQVLSEVAFTAEAGEFPERTREELSSQRPLGASFTASRRATLFTEIATPEQFPGILQQAARRMQGVRVSKTVLDPALEDVRKELAHQLFGEPNVALYHQVREIGLDRKDDEILRRASGRGIAKLTAAEVQQQLARFYVPANAALSLAGNLAGVDVRTLVGNLFGSIPAGTERPRNAPSGLQARSRVMRLAGIPAPAAAIGVMAPALADSLHPSFYLNAMILGSHLSRTWGKESPAARWHYAIFDEPDLLRLFPPAEKMTDAEAVGAKLGLALNVFSTLIVTREPYEEVRASARWLLGGPMSPEQAKRAPYEPMMLHALARSMATRSLWESEEFWREYRERFDREPPGMLGRWLDYFRDPSRQIRLLVLPRT